MHEPESPDLDRPEPVRRLEVLPDLSRESTLPGRLPLHRDPIYQLGALGVLFFAALGASLLVSGPFLAVLEAAVLAISVFACAVLLRSVRHGWNVGAYARTRRALGREATLRIERDALRSSCLALGATLTEGRPEEGWQGLQPLVARLQRVLERVEGRSALAVVEETGGAYLVLAVSGYICERPSAVAPGKSCPADRTFVDLLGAFAPHGSTSARPIESEGRRYWAGALCARPAGGTEEELARTLAAWVAILAATGPRPARIDPLLRVG